MVDWITDTVNFLGYWGIGLLMFLENLFPADSLELIMPLAGLQWRRASWSLSTDPGGVVGTVAGSLPWYYVGKLLGERTCSGWPTAMASG